MTDKTALVTGGGRGIGKAIVLSLAEKGWNIAVNYRSNSAAADKTVGLAEKAGGSAQAIQADIGTAEGREKLLTGTLETYGKIDLLVNNAAMAPKNRNDILELTESEYDEVMDVNLKGPFFLTQKIAAGMIEFVKSGMCTNPIIINIGSVSSYASSTNRAQYCISKAGVSMMTVLFADRLAESGINVYEIRPGIIETDMTKGVKEKYDSLIEDGLTPIKRWGRPEDVARAVCAIAEGVLPFSTGEVINVDGGFHIRRL